MPHCPLAFMAALVYIQENRVSAPRLNSVRGWPMLRPEGGLDISTHTILVRAEGCLD
jgi:hypothetical protein